MEQKPNSKMTSKDLEEIILSSEKDIVEGRVISQEELDNQDLKWLTRIRKRIKIKWEKK
jgi:hypothetical protein